MVTQPESTVLADERKPAPEVLVRHPVIVVCIPAYNEERFLGRAIESLRQQTWTDFAVLISDNASSDRTSEIAAAAAQQDPRFYYYRHDENRGGCGNFNFLRESTDSPYFMWLGAHDYLAPTFLERHVEALEANPEASVAYCHAAWIDEEGRKFQVTTSKGMDSLPDVRLVRYVLTCRQIDFCTEINNVIRRKCLEGIRYTEVFGTDMIMLAHLAYQGPFVCIPEELYMFMRVPESVRPEDYMKRLTGREGLSEDPKALIRDYDARLRLLARGNPLRPLASLAARALLEKRYIPNDAGPLARSLMWVGGLKQRLRRVVAGRSP